jgi:Flp pilus assembly protein TadD
MHGLNTIPAEFGDKRERDADPDNYELSPAEAYHRRGDALLKLERFGEAIESYDGAIALDPNDARAFNNRGNALKGLARFGEALENFERAIALTPGRAELYSNRGNVLFDLERLEDAIESYDIAIKLKPTHASFYSNRAVALGQLKRVDEALADMETALLLKPDHAEMIFNKSLLSLLSGNFTTGWREYEARKRTEKSVGHQTFDKPLWLGDADIAGKTILIHWEQGYGDVILFSRYARLCEDAGARVLFAPQPDLKELMQGLHGNIHIVNLTTDFLLFDCHCPLMSLPLAFRTELATIPRQPYLCADPEKVVAWGNRLGQKTRPRVGVVWNRTGGEQPGRSIPLEQFQRLFEPEIEFVSLQKYMSDAECARLDQMNVRRPGHALVDFSDTAALCCLMDLVISIDTSVAHLAGALQIPTWVLLPSYPIWIWMLDREDSPWYPSVRLFSQQTRGDWDGVLQRVQGELKARFG